MTWKNIFPIASLLILIIILLLVSNSIIKSCKRSDASLSNFQTLQLSTDTVYSKPDTVLLSDTIFIPHLSAKLDTVYIDTTEIISAAADTTLIKDSSRISVKYFFPPLNYFEIDLQQKEKLITRTQTITEVKEYEKPTPFYKDHWFWTTVGLILLLINNITQ